MGVPQQAQHRGGQLADEELWVGGPRRSIHDVRIELDRERAEAGTGRRTQAWRRASRLRLVVAAGVLAFVVGAWDGDPGAATNLTSSHGPTVLTAVVAWGSDGDTLLRSEPRVGPSTVPDEVGPPRAPRLSSRVWVARGLASGDLSATKAAASVPKDTADLSADGPGTLLPV